MKTLYEVNWHYKDKKQMCFSHCTVTPIKVIREGILPGCTEVSITAVDMHGRKFNSSPNEFFASEQAAWESVRRALLGTIANNEEELEIIKNETRAIFKFLNSLPAAEN